MIFIKKPLSLAFGKGARHPAVSPGESRQTCGTCGTCGICTDSIGYHSTICGKLAADLRKSGGTPNPVAIPMGKDPPWPSIYLLLDLRITPADLLLGLKAIYRFLGA